QPTNATAGAALSPAVTVKVEDQFGNVATSDTSTVAMAASGPAGFDAGSSTSGAAAGGVGTSEHRRVEKAGSYDLSASDGKITATEESSCYTMRPAAASRVVFGQQPTDATAGAALSPAVTVKVEDQFGNVVTSDTSTVAMAVASGPGGFDAGSTTSVAAVGGVATFSNLKLDAAGSYTLSATDGTLAGTGASSSFTISPAAASQVVFGQQPTDAT